MSTFGHNFIPLIYYGPWFRHYYQELFCSTEVAFLASALKGRGRCCNVPCQFIRLILVLKLPDQLRKLSILLILPVIEGLGMIVKSLFKFRFAGTYVADFSAFFLHRGFVNDTTFQAMAIEWTSISTFAVALLFFTRRAVLAQYPQIVAANH